MMRAAPDCIALVARVVLAAACALSAACTITTVTFGPQSKPVASLWGDSALEAARADLAPGGTLRAAINLGNPILATRDAATGLPRGVSVDLARELSSELGVPLTLEVYDAAGKVAQAASRGAWDIAFLAIDPVRAREIAYSAPYVIIEGAYLVPQASPITRLDEVDRAGVRIVVGNGSAYDLYLTREIRQAALVRAPSSQQVVPTLLEQRLEVAAGVRQQLQADAQRVPGLRLLDGRFMQIRQAIGTPVARKTGQHYLDDFVERMKDSGFVAKALARHGIEGAEVAGPAR